MAEFVYQADEPTDEESAFALAVEHYRHTNKRRFPTAREILAVARSLGYRRVCAPDEQPAQWRKHKRNHSR